MTNKMASQIVCPNCGEYKKISETCRSCGYEKEKDIDKEEIEIEEDEE